jgi:hypothetical protein
MRGYNVSYGRQPWSVRYIDNYFGDDLQAFIARIKRHYFWFSIPTYQFNWSIFLERYGSSELRIHDHTRNRS